MPSATGVQRARTDRMPPYSEEAERGVLGSILLDAGRVMDLCIERQLVPESFHVHQHRVAFDVMERMHSERKPIDILTTSDRLKALGLLEESGGSGFLERLIDSTPTAAHAEYYIEIVRQNHLLRQIIGCSGEAIDDCYKAEEHADAILGNAQQALFAISEDQRASMTPLPKLLDDAEKEVNFLKANPGTVSGIPTGFKDLDHLLMGLQPSDMIILAARPSMGKTALALNIAENVMRGNGSDQPPRPVAFFSLEMAADAVVRRLICTHARVESQKLRGGFLSDQLHGAILQAIDVFRQAPLYIDDAAGLNVSELRSRARLLKHRYGIQLIIVDYLQLLNDPHNSDDGRQRETAAISSSLKAMAKELKIPILVLSQLSRAPETRDKTSGVPRLSDLRDSGSIEQDADVVCLLRRPCYYPDDKDFEDKHLAILDVRKHRNGPTGEIELHFIAEYAKFENRAHKGVDAPPDDAAPQQVKQPDPDTQMDFDRGEP